MKESRNDRLKRFAREMRIDPTLGERLLWRELKDRQLSVRFRRQMPIGPFIADFVCPHVRLVVEVDGDSHTNPRYDRRRDAWLASEGWYVLRFTDLDVIEGMDSVVDIICRAIKDPRGTVEWWNTVRSD